MKKSAGKRIIIWSIVSVVLIAVLVWSIICVKNYSSSWNYKIFDSAWFSINNLEDFETGDAEFVADDVKSVDINWVAGDIKVVYSDTDKITIKESDLSNKDEKMCWYLDNDGELEIYATKKVGSFINFGSNYIIKTLTITVPKEHRFSDFDIDTASADVYADGINSTEFNADTAAGKVEIKKLDCENANINNVSGEIDVYCNQVNEIDVDTVSGKCSILGSYRDIDFSGVSGDVTIAVENDDAEVDVETVSGEVKMEVIESISGFTVEYDSVNGDFDSEFSGTNRGGMFIYGDGKSSFNIDTVSGGIEITSYEVVKSAIE